LRAWAAEVVETLDESRADADLFTALVAEGAVDGRGNTKPTHLHFTAGQQRFLQIARELAAAVDADRLREALFGPWREDSPLPSLSWNSGGERLYALRAIDPAKDKRLGVPGPRAATAQLHGPPSTTSTPRPRPGGSCGRCTPPGAPALPHCPRRCSSSPRWPGFWRRNCGRKNTEPYRAAKSSRLTAVPAVNAGPEHAQRH
jgi:hypothetical protein